MKNNNIVNAMILIIVAIFFVIFQYVRFSSNTIDEKLYNRIWYKYNYNNGYYDSLIIEKNNIIYNKLSVNSSNDDYSNCSSYYFNKKNNSLALDCNKNIIFEIEYATQTTCNLKPRFLLGKYSQYKFKHIGV